MTPKENTSLVWPISLVMVNLSAYNENPVLFKQIDQRILNYAHDLFTS